MFNSEGLTTAQINVINVLVGTVEQFKDHQTKVSKEYFYCILKIVCEDQTLTYKIRTDGIISDFQTKEHSAMYDLFSSFAEIYRQ